NQQISFILDGQLFLTLPHPDLEWIEAMVHLPLLYAEKTDRIFVIGAGIKGIIPEIMKYRAKSIDCIEANPELIRVIKKFLPSYFQPSEKSKINIIKDDAIRLLRKTRKKWDVIILDAGIPFSLKTARFYTKEFFELAKNHLSEDGILYIGIEGSTEYMSQPLVDVHSIIYATLTSVFPRVSVVPGYLTGYCATKAKNSPEISSQLLILKKKEKNISTTVLTEFYLKDRLDSEKKQNFLKMIESGKEAKNSINRPFILVPAIKYWTFLSSGELKNIRKPVFLISLISIFTFLAFLFNIKKKKGILEFIVFSTGFLSVAWELVFLFLFQMYFGSLYFYLSVLTGAFMAGLAGGSLAFSSLSVKIKNWKNVLLIWQLIQMGFAFFAFVFIYFLSNIAVSAVLFFFIIAVTGIFAGWEFPLVNRIYISDRNPFSKSISTFYAFDLAGATVGSILTALVLVPFLGIALSCVLFGMVKLLAAIFVWKLR
ncbi:MAG: hypothetical protein NC937_03910, partial [Candidatus Omnitrophica bacterium]|nr:hypothetical protein [Candidatus Omnitrophota bacterium]